MHQVSKQSLRCFKGLYIQFDRWSDSQSEDLSDDQSDDRMFEFVACRFWFVKMK